MASWRWCACTRVPRYRYFYKKTVDDFEERSAAIGDDLIDLVLCYTISCSNFIKQNIISFSLVRFFTSALLITSYAVAKSPPENHLD